MREVIDNIGNAIMGNFSEDVKRKRSKEFAKLAKKEKLYPNPKNRIPYKADPKPIQRFEPKQKEQRFTNKNQNIEKGENLANIYI